MPDIMTKIAEINTAKSAIKTAIEGKNVTVPDNTKLDGMAALIDSISSGGGSSSETWVLNENGYLTQEFTGLFFSSNGGTFTSIVNSDSGWIRYLKYDDVDVCEADLDVGAIAWKSTGWSDPQYRVITFSTPPSGDLLTWLEAYALKV